MKTKLIIATLIAFMSFNFQCTPDEPTTQVEEGCDCRKMYYTQQTVNYSVQFVYTHRGEWEKVDCGIKESGTLQPNGFIWTGFTPIDDTHNYRWECKNQ